MRKRLTDRDKEIKTIAKRFQRRDVFAEHLNDLTKFSDKIKGMSLNESDKQDLEGDYHTLTRHKGDASKLREQLRIIQEVVKAVKNPRVDQIKVAIDDLALSVVSNRSNSSRRPEDFVPDIVGESEEEEPQPKPKPKPSRGRATKRKPKHTIVESESDEEVAVVDPDSPKPKRAPSRGRPSKKHRRRDPTSGKLVGGFE